MGYDMHVRGHKSDLHGSLHRNMSGTRLLLQDMAWLGMAHSSPRWARARSFPDWHTHVSYDEKTQEWKASTPTGVRYLLEENEYLSAHRSDKPGIPDHKFGSNDGWHVTAEECQQALAAYDAMKAKGVPDPMIFSDDLIPFLRLAAAHDGFEVW